mmetsp:Transcript_41404/g.82918  ORF Transcript_41404/g.82918 Transcript_41404/m.82918 type:complete len:200 (-) Transcript_41404:139-738(-)
MCLSPSPAGFSGGMGLSIFVGGVLLWISLVEDTTPLDTQLLIAGVLSCGCWLLVRTVFEAWGREEREAEKESAGPRDQWLFFMAWSFSSWCGCGYLASAFLAAARQGVAAGPLSRMGVQVLWLSLLAQVVTGTSKTVSPRTLNLLMWLQHAGVVLGGVGVYSGPAEWLLGLTPFMVGYLLDPAAAHLSADLFHPRRLLG